jgi:hypothetical protein
MWAAKVDRSETGSSEDSRSAANEGAGSDRAPQGSETTGGEESPQDFDRSDMWEEPATGTGESTMDDPNGSLSF